MHADGRACTAITRQVFNSRRLQERVADHDEILNSKIAPLLIQRLRVIYYTD